MKLNSAGAGPGRAACLGLALAGGAFLALAAGVASLGALPADGAVREALVGWARPALVAPLRVVNHAGEWRVLLPALLVLFAALPAARARWWAWAGAMVAAPAAEWLLKQAIGRPRPEDLSFGFPSGHATAAAAFFGAVMYLAGSLPARAARIAVRAAAATAILLVGLARVALGAHWPSDALGGIALGLAFASAAGVVAFRQVPPSGER